MADEFQGRMRDSVREHLDKDLEAFAKFACNPRKDRERVPIEPSIDGFQLDGDCCTADQLAAIDPSSLEEVSDLSMHDAELGEAGIDVITRWIKQGAIPDLDSIDLAGSKVGSRGVVKLVRVLVDVPGLETLKLDGTYRSDESSLEAVRDFVSDAPSLKEVSLYNTWLDDTGMLTVAQGLVNSRSITCISLDWNQIGRAGAEALAQAIRGMPTLRRVEVNHNFLEGDGATPILNMLEYCPNISHVGLAANRIESLKYVENAALASPGLRSLVLNNNNLNVPGTVELAPKLAGCQGLTALYLQNNKLGNNGVCYLMHSLLQQRTSIRCLDLGYNMISHQGVMDIAIYIGDPSCQLLKLDLTGNEIGDEGLAVLDEAVQQTPTLRFLTLVSCGIVNGISYNIPTPKAGEGMSCRLEIEESDVEKDEDGDDAKSDDSANS